MKRILLLAALCLLPLLAFGQNNASGNLTTSGSSCTATNCVFIVLPAAGGTVGVSLSGTFSATVQFEMSADGTNFVSANALPQPSGTAVASATATGTWAIPAAGMWVVRARASSYSSGTVGVFMNAANSTVATQQAGGGGTLSQVQGTAAAGSAPSGNPVQVGGWDGTNMRTLKTDNGGVMAITNSGASADGDGDANSAYTVNGAQSNGRLLVRLNLWNGATWDRQFYCNQSASFSVAATTTQIVALSGSTKIRVCSFVMSGNATAGSMALVTGTGTNCATSQTSLTGTINVLGTTAPPVVYSGGSSAPYITPASQALCVLATTTTASGSVTYAQY